LNQIRTRHVDGRSNGGDLDYIVCLKLRSIMPSRPSIRDSCECRTGIGSSAGLFAMVASATIA
jgi:hypothetical protein